MSLIGYPVSPSARRRDAVPFSQDQLLSAMRAALGHLAHAAADRRVGKNRRVAMAMTLLRRGIAKGDL